MTEQGSSFRSNNYVPELGDVVHLNWDPAIGHEMKGPHYGLVLSATLFSTATGMVVVAPITSPRGKVSGFEIVVQAGRVNGVAVLSGVRCLDYQSRAVEFENRVKPAVVMEANRRLHLVFPIA